SYAVPGSALAVGVAIGYGRWLAGTALIILVAYLAKFWILGYLPVRAALDRLSAEPVRAARVSGAGPATTLATVVLPPLRTAVELAVAPGEVVALLCQSGSGKTTLLHAVAGFVAPAGGEIRLGGRTVSTARRCTPPERRWVGMVFQSYALWPHLTVLDTVAYPLRRRGVGGAAARTRAHELL